MKKEMYVVQINNGEHTYLDIKTKYLCVVSNNKKAMEYCHKKNEKNHYNSNIHYSWESVTSNDKIKNYKNKGYVIIYKQYLDYLGCHYKQAIECYSTKKQAKQRKKYLNRLVRQTSGLFKYLSKQCDIYSIKTLPFKKSIDNK